MKKYFLIVIITFIANAIFAQKVWVADLPVVNKNDYYNVELSQEMIGAGLEYLKIFDTDNKEVPYFIRSADPVQEINNFEHFELKSSYTKDSINIVVVNNKFAENISRFCVVMQKADVQIYTTIRGSNDLNQWYIVKQHTEVSRSVQKTSGNKEMLILDFPQGNYRYYEITIWSNQNSPLEIYQVGKIKNSNIYGNFVEIDFGKILQTNDDEKKITYIRFPEIKNIYNINKLDLFIRNKPDYYRQAIFCDSIYYNKKNLVLSSRKENRFYMDRFQFTSNSMISINNERNPPLVVDSIKIYGLCRYACVYLEAGENYRLYLNHEEAISDTYDIEHFRNVIPVDLSTLHLINQRDSIIKASSSVQRKLSFIEQPVILWSIIIVVGLFLLILCIKMINDLNKRP